jgi:pantetheine-phosphate adenylyltransferase
MAERIAVYPGMFDPVTNGHLDLIERGVKIFDRLVVAVVTNPSKTPLFTIEERVSMLQKVTRNIANIELDSFNGLLVDFVRQKKANFILRGLRAVSDFEYEFEMALTNRKLANDIETVFMAPSLEYIYLRARLVKEVSKVGGDISDYVPGYVAERLKEKFCQI